MEMTTGADSMSAREDILRMATELADAISLKDAQGAAKYIRQGDHVVYISDGMVIRGTEYRSVLEQFYASVQRIDFKWDLTEIRVIDGHTGVFTGRARITMTDAQGVTVTDHAIFTIIYARRDGGWELVSAHKTTVP